MSRFSCLIVYSLWAGFSCLCCLIPLTLFPLIVSTLNVYRSLKMCLLHSSLTQWNWLSNQFIFLRFASEGLFLFLGGFHFFCKLFFLLCLKKLFFFFYCCIFRCSSVVRCELFWIMTEIIVWCLHMSSDSWLLSWRYFDVVSFLLRFSSFIFVVDELFFFGWSWFIHGWFVLRIPMRTKNLVVMNLPRVIAKYNLKLPLKCFLKGK